MSGYGRAAKAQLIGTSGNLVNTTSGGALKVDSAYRRFIPLGLIRLNATTPVRLPTIACSIVMIRNPEGNATVWVGGSEEAYYAAIDVTQPIYETEMIPFEVTNADELTLIAEAINTDVYVAVFTNDDVVTEVSDPGPPDITPPTVVSSLPVNGATNIETNTAITVTFSEPILDTSITNTSLSVSPAVTFTSSLDSVDFTKANLIPTSNLALSTTYTVTASTAVMDLVENAMVAPYVFSFQTKAAPPPPDTTPPTVISTTPANNALGISPSFSPTISFSEDLLDASATTTTVKVFKDSDSSAVTVSNIAHSPDGKTITLTLSGIANATKYRIVITGGASGVKDVAGNALAADYTSYYTTVSSTPSVLYTLSSDSVWVDMDNTVTEVLQTCADSQCFFYGKIITSFQFTAGKNNSATGTLECIILNSSNTVVHTFPETKSASSVDVHQGTYTLDSPSNSYVMQVGDKIGIRYTSGTSSNFIEIHYNEASTYNGTHSIMRIKQNGTYIDRSSDDMAVVISGV